MKTCPHCDTGYPDSLAACPTHGVPLNEIRDLKPGMVIHQSYRIVRKLGQGGMGAVYLAQHTLMNEPQALKFLSSELSHDQAFTARFLREVRTLRQIRHKNVVDAGNLEPAEDGTLFFSMEYVDGPDLRRFLHDAPQPFDVPLALEITRGIAVGLGAAHAKGMVHRDIKPENILMAQDGGAWVPKIADFGIVATKESSTVYTRTGGTLLTMAYAAPEQWRGTPSAGLDGRTDLYALGGVLFEMLTGQTPFHAENYEGWARQHQNAPPQPPSTLRPDLANWQGLDALFLRLLAKDRNDRPKDVAELLSLLDAVRLVPPESHRETEIDGPTAQVSQKAAEERIKPARHWGIWSGLLAGGLILAALAVWFGLHRLQQPAKTAMQVPPAVQSQTEKDQPEQPQLAQPANPKSTNQKPVGPSESKPAQVEAPKPSSQQPEVVSHSKPAPVASSKPFAQQPSIAEIEKQANVLSGEGRYSEAAPLLDQACTGGSSEACRNLGSMYIQGTGVEKDASRGITLLAKACDAGNGTSCGNLGAMYLQGTGAAKDESKAAGFLSKACDAGNVQGCNALGYMYLNGNGVAKDNSRAATLLSKGCDAGIALSCSNLGVMYENGSGVAKDYFRAAGLYTKACDARVAVSCGQLGSLYEFGSGVAKDYSRAAGLYTKACDAGIFPVCSQLGAMYQLGNGVKQDYPRAVALYSKSCDGGYGWGCRNLANMYVAGKGVAKDDSTAATFFTKACDTGEPNSCAALGLLYESGHGVTKDYSRAAALYAKSCDGGEAAGCSSLGESYRNGWGVGRDMGKAREFFKKGCSMGNQWGCDQLKKSVPHSSE